MIPLDIVPGKAVGNFHIGMPLFECINFIQQEQIDIPSVKISCDEKNPLTSSIKLRINSMNLTLKFEALTQRLKHIEVGLWNQSNLPQLRYSGVFFCSPDIKPTYKMIYKNFGPSHPGELDKENLQYILQYPGLVFTFNIPKENLEAFSNNEIPIEFPDRTSIIASTMKVFYGKSYIQSLLPSLPQNNLYLEPIITIISQGILFSKRNRIIDFDSSVQDVLSELGPPNHVYYKEEDKMRIHSGQGNFGTGCGDYFFNYFNLGVDFLFDIITHEVKKITLHTNFPLHYDFSRYTKCNFSILTKLNEKQSTKTQNSNNTNTNNDQSNDDQLKCDLYSLNEQIKEKSQQQIEAILNNFTIITPETRWVDVQKILGESTKPVINKREISEYNFSATMFFGYRDIIFEIAYNEYIATICLYSTKHQQRLRQIEWREQK
eukprot:TRINITY_DN2149_c2_g1_i2.p1 TRINITY_DN2149_c2_g1~~TRINITY_DN2149_c2_g1_i2.p1  ORF type:complete len:433 (-),score=132.97 TRINITY_DN2149_c2_g1_i2:70-1368(-)